MDRRLKSYGGTALVIGPGSGRSSNGGGLLMSIPEVLDDTPHDTDRHQTDTSSSSLEITPVREEFYTSGGGGGALGSSDPAT